VQVLDMVQFLPKLPKCMNIFLQKLHSLYDVRNITSIEVPINRSTYIHKYPPGSYKQVVKVQKLKLLPRTYTRSQNIITLIDFFALPQNQA